MNTEMATLLSQGWVIEGFASDHSNYKTLVRKDDELRIAELQLEGGKAEGWKYVVRSLIGVI